MYGVGQKNNKPVYCCNNVVYCLLIFVIFGTHTPDKTCNWRIYN